MGYWHKDAEVEAALVKLNDALGVWERATGRQCALFLIPEMSDERIHVSHNGKPLPLNFDMSPEALFTNAMARRERE